MKRAWKKMLPPFFAILLVVPAVFFVRPQKSDAIVGCLAGMGTNALIGAVQSITAVPTSDKQTGFNTGGNFAKECALDAIAKGIAAAALKSFTASTVEWINSGFRGSPSFVTNPEGFLLDVADREFGREIEAIAPFLCSPFRLNLQFALGLQYSFTGRDDVRCRLSDVIANAQGSYDAFVAGNFNAGGWKNWIQISGTPANNVYGAYLSTIDRLDASIVTASGKEIKLLDWGQGFRSWRSCEQWEEKIVNGKKERGKCLKEGAIKTPGSIIVGQGNSTLQSNLRELEVADEIDEIFGALINQLLVRTLGSGGLLGNSKPSAGGGRSYVQQLLETSDPNAARRLATTNKPAGINCQNEYEAAGGESNQLMLVTYVPEGGSEGGKTTRIPKPATMPDGTPIVNPYKTSEGKIDWVTYFQEVRIGCQNELTRIAELDQEEAFARAYPGDQFNVEVDAGSFDGNISLGKSAVQSSTYVGGSTACKGRGDGWTYQPSAFNAVNGSKEGGGYGGLALTACGREQWWRVDLATGDNSDTSSWTVEEIRSIKIYGASGNTYGYYTLYANPFVVAVTKIDPIWKNPTAVLAENEIYAASMTKNNPEPGSNLITTITFNPPISSSKAPRYVYIGQNFTTGTDYLGIAEVEVFGKQRNGPSSGSRTGGTGGTPPAPTLEVSLQPTYPNTVPDTLVRGQSISKQLKLTSNMSAEDVRLQVRLSTKEGSGSEPLRDKWSSYFERVTFKTTVGGSAVTTPNFVVSNKINPSICTGSSTRIPRGECTTVGGISVQTVSAPIIFAEHISLSPDNPVFIDFEAEILRSGFVAPQEFFVDVEVTDSSGTRLNGVSGRSIRFAVPF